MPEIIFSLSFHLGSPLSALSGVSRETIWRKQLGFPSVQPFVSRSPPTVLKMLTPWHLQC
jgi:hypothetical protein